MISQPISVSPNLIPQQPIGILGNQGWNFSLNFDNTQPIYGIKLSVKEKNKNVWEDVPIEQIYINNSQAENINNSQLMSFYNFSADGETSNFALDYRFTLNNAVTLANKNSRLLNFLTSKYYADFSCLYTAETTKKSYTNISYNERPVYFDGVSRQRSNVNVLRIPVYRNMSEIDSDFKLYLTYNSADSSAPFSNHAITVSPTEKYIKLISSSAATDSESIAPYLLRSRIDLSDEESKTSGTTTVNSNGQALTIYGQSYQYGKYFYWSSSNATTVCNDYSYNMSLINSSMNISILGSLYPYWNNTIDNNGSIYAGLIDAGTYGGKTAIKISPASTDSTTYTFTVGPNFCNSNAPLATETENVFKVNNSNNYEFQYRPLITSSTVTISSEDINETRIFAQTNDSLQWKVKMYNSIDQNINVDNWNFICKNKIQEPQLILGVKTSSAAVTPSVYIHIFTIPYNYKIQVGDFFKVFNQNTKIYDYLLIQDIPYSSASAGIMAVSVVLGTSDNNYTKIDDVEYYNSSENGGIDFEIYSRAVLTDNYYFEIKERMDIQWSISPLEGFYFSDDKLILLTPMVSILINEVKNVSSDKIIFCSLKIKDAITKNVLYENEQYNQNSYVFPIRYLLKNNYRYLIEIVAKDNNGYLHQDKKYMNVIGLWSENTEISTLLKNRTYESLQSYQKGISAINQTEDYFCKEFEDKGIISLECIQDL